MRTNTKKKLSTLVLAALGLLYPTAGLHSAATAAPGTGLPASGPVAGPIEVFTFAEVVSSPLGTLVETTLVVENHGADPASVFLLGRFTWPDGSAGLLRYGPPATVAPHGALILIALSPVPASVGSGAGTFTANAFVGAIGTGGRGSFSGPLLAQDSSVFELP